MGAQWLPARRVVEGGPADAWKSTGDVSCWTLLLTAGDELEPDAVLQIERFLQAPREAELNLIYFDHDEIHDGQPPKNPQFKPDTNPDLLLSMPYVGRAVAVRTDWALTVIEARQATHCNLELAYRLALGVLRDCGPAGLGHLPLLLAHLDSREPTLYAGSSAQWQAQAALLQQHLAESAPDTQLLEGPAAGTFHRVYPLPHQPLVSIIIPSRDQLSFLSRCIESLFGKTSYPNFEVLVVDNDSQTSEARDYLQGLAQLTPDRLRVLRAPGAFNFSRMNNMAVEQANGELILLLNNDTAFIQSDWLQHMVRHALRPEIGIVGARLLYPEGTVQHAGVIMGLRGPADHPCLGLKADEPGYMFRAQLTQNFSAVTAACMLVRKSVYQEVGGLNEREFAVSYNDVDFCLRVGETGRRIVWTPLATVLHEGSASQKASIENISKANKELRFTAEQSVMYERWPTVIANDPAYNPNLSLVERGFEVETNPLLIFDPFIDKSKPKIVAFAADHMGCGNYRILQPMQAMLDTGLCIGGSSPEIFGPNLALRSQANVLVFQRPNNDLGIRTLEALIPLRGIKKIYEVDDNLTRVPVKSAHFAMMPKDTRGRMLRSMGLCDRLVVSTESLAHEFRNANDDIRVVLNRLPPNMWGKNPPPRMVRQLEKGRKPVIAWAGGIGHGGDLEMVEQVIRELASVVDWEFFGMCPDRLRPFVSKVHVGVPTLEYPRRLMELSSSWDLAIAPLELNAFNESKSNLRLLEYGWCGIPVVCSDITPYQGGLPVTRVKNRHKDWVKAIQEKLADLDTLRKEGLELQEEVQRHWMLDGKHVEDWFSAWTGD